MALRGSPGKLSLTEANHVGSGSDRCAELCDGNPYQAAERNYASQMRKGDKAVQARTHDTQEASGLVNKMCRLTQQPIHRLTSTSGSPPPVPERV